jgi:predicted transcriptional regulator YdeE
MATHQLGEFSVIGISVRTTNENGKSAQDIPTLWATFMSEGIMAKIPNKLGDDLYCMYTDYERDHTRPYTTILGCRVSTLESIPEGMAGKTIEAETYTKFVAKGNLAQGVVLDSWMKIWNSDLSRRYTTDFEVYGQDAQNPENAKVAIFIAVSQ